MIILKKWLPPPTYTQRLKEKKADSCMKLEQPENKQMEMRKNVCNDKLVSWKIMDISCEIKCKRGQRPIDREGRHVDLYSDILILGIPIPSISPN